MRTLVRSSDRTRGSRRSRSWSCPAHVDGDHGGRPPLEQAIGEAARGRPGVERHHAAHLDGEAVQGGVELFAAAADEARRRSGDDDGFGRIHQAGGSKGHRPADQHHAGVDELDRLVPAIGESAADQLGVESPARAKASPVAFLAGVAFFAGKSAPAS